VIRLLQLRNALTARVAPQEIAALTAVLSPDEMQLFASMSAAGMRHGLNVFHTLRMAGEQDACLLRAALLHDCGKRTADGRPLAVIWYVIGSQLERLPRLYRLLSGAVSVLAVYRDHAALGARLLAAAGSDDCLCQLVLRHHQISDDWRVQRLKWADAQH
jgi:hypothetical protein